uniref:QKI, KH domain containing, RNA binding 2 n=1 Tax=Hucho hucho TaxID=62062 RepID=A0A4W5M7I4_9TELE
MYNDSMNGGVAAERRDSEELPDGIGPVAQLQEKLYVPVKEYPDFNFVGRILGPRGLTAKQLEAETGCKIMVRGKGSMRDKKKEELNRGKPNWEHLSEELHVLITVEDSHNRAQIKLQRATAEVKKLLVPAVSTRSFMLCVCVCVCVCVGEFGNSPGSMYKGVTMVMHVKGGDEWRDCSHFLFTLSLLSLLTLNEFPLPLSLFSHLNSFHVSLNISPVLLASYPLPPDLTQTHYC